MKTQIYDSWADALQKAENTLNCYRDGSIMSDIISSIADFRSALVTFTSTSYSYKREDAYRLMLTAFGRLSGYMFHYKLDFWMNDYLHCQKTFMSQILTSLACQ